MCYQTDRLHPGDLREEKVFNVSSASCLEEYLTEMKTWCH